MMNKKRLILTMVCLLLFNLVLSATVMAIDVDVDINDNGNSIFKIMNDINIPSDRVVDGDVVTIMGDINVNGRVKGDVVAVLGDIFVNNVIEGDLVSIMGEIEKGSKTQVSGDTTEVSIGKENFDFAIPPFIDIFGWNLKIFKLIMLFGLSVLIFSLMPKKQEHMALAIEKEFFRKLFIGIISILLLPIVMFLFVLTIIGIPFIPVLLLTFVVIKFIGYVAVVFLVGCKIAEIGKKDFNIYLKLLIGVVVLWLLNSIPVIGFMLYSMVSFLALGVIIDTKFGTNNPWFKRKEVEAGNSGDEDQIE